MHNQAILQKAKDFKGKKWNSSTSDERCLLPDGLTSHGELCTDGCEKRGYPYFWCHKKSSNLGQWWDSDFCSPLSTVTHYGKVRIILLLSSPCLSNLHVRNVKTNVSRGGRNTSGVTEKLTVVGDTAHPILFTKKVSNSYMLFLSNCFLQVSALQIMGMEMVSTPLWGIVKGIQKTCIFFYSYVIFSGIYHVVEVGP